MALGFILGYAYFAVCSLVAIVGALCTVLAKNPIRGAMGLLMMIISMAGIFLALHAEFLAVVQLIVYAGAIVVLFLFVIMLLGPSARIPDDTRGRLPRALSALLFVSASLALGAAVIVPKMSVPGGFPKAPGDIVPPGFGGIRAIGGGIFEKALIPFELSSLLLMVAVIGAVAIARGKKSENEELGPEGRAVPGPSKSELASPTPAVIAEGGAHDATH